MGLSAETKGIFWRAVAIVIAMMPFMPANAQVDSFTEKVVGGTKEFVRETEAFIENTLDRSSLAPVLSATFINDCC